MLGLLISIELCVYTKAYLNVLGVGRQQNYKRTLFIYRSIHFTVVPFLAHAYCPALLPLLEAPLKLTFRNNVGQSATALEFRKQPPKFTPAGVILLAEKSKVTREQFRELRNFVTDQQISTFQNGTTQYRKHVAGKLGNVNIKKSKTQYKD